jgi:AraC-like DNA-binding protein
MSVPVVYARADGARGVARFRAGVHAHSAEVVVETRLHEGAGGGIKRLGTGIRRRSVKRWSVASHYLIGEAIGFSLQCLGAMLLMPVSAPRLEIHGECNVGPAGPFVKLRGGRDRWPLRPSLNTANRTMDRRVRKVVAFLEERIALRVRVGELARQVGLGTSRLEHLFKLNARVSIRDFVRERRLLAAKALLETTEERISSIGYTVGFQDMSNFNHAFKRRFGLSPRAYRDRVQDGSATEQTK